MATDIDAVIRNITSFYDMREKSIVHVGAGGGQAIGYATVARTVLGVDCDPEAVSRLEAAIRDRGLQDRFQAVRAEFSSVSTQADVVFFEFCLHEMEDPAEAVRHASTLAPEVLVIDHVPESPWAWYACEEAKAARSWAAVRRRSVIREASYEATQYFEDYFQLLSRIEVLGEQAVARISEFEGEHDIRIQMLYALALVRGDAAQGREE